MSTPEKKDVLAELDKILENDIANRHSYFQMQYFIVGKEPTTQAKMWQCLREIRSRRDAIRQICIDLDEAADQDRLLQIQLEREMAASLNAEELENKEDPRQEATWQLEEHKLRCRQITRKRLNLRNGLQDLEKRLQYATEEAIFFLEMFKQLNESTPLKPFDDLESQKEYWQERLANEIHFRALLSQPMDLELLKTTLALPDTQPIKKDVVTMLNTITAKMMQMKKEKEMKRDT